MELELFLTELQPFKVSHFRQLLHCMVRSLCYQLLPQFSMAVSQTLHCEHIEDVQVCF